MSPKTRAAAAADYQCYARSLRNWNYGVAAVHASSFVALLVLTLTNLDRLLTFPLWIDAQQTVRVLAEQPLSATLLPFPFITACFHLAQALGVARYYRCALVYGVTPHRWLEYAITNGLITWSVFVMAGAGNVLLPVTGLVLNALMNFFGLLHERANSRCQQTTLAYLWYGFLPWLPLWYVPLTYYGLGPADTPGYQGWAIVGTFALSLAFTFPLFWRYMTTTTAEMRANYQVERAYLLLSLTAKLYLDWVVTAGNLWF